MQTKNLFGIFLLLFCSVGLISCDKEHDDGLRGFMQEATIVGDSINGYYCYLDGGGLAISKDPWLEGIERGYFAFHYLEENEGVNANQEWYIQPAHVLPYSIYPVVHPISIAEAESKHLTDRDSCQIPSLFSLEYGYRGYFDFNTGLSVTNLANGEKVPIQLNMVYDAEKQTPDTLLLQLCYHPRVPDKWAHPSFDYGRMSCDISSLATLRSWSDSVTLVIDTGDEMKHLTKISKTDFFKPVRE